MKKRIISFLLVVCLLFSMAPITAFAVDVVASGTCGDNLTWTLAEKGTLTISGTGAMTDWDLLKHDVPWYDHRNEIVLIEIQDGITSIGEAAFSDCDNLMEVLLPESLSKIGTYAFDHCGNLKTIHLPSGVSKIGNYAFTDCNLLEEITVSADNLYYASNDGVLYNKGIDTLIAWPCAKGNAQIPNTVTKIGMAAFAYCNRITEIVIPDSVTSISSYAFESCDNLSKVTIVKDPSLGQRPFKSCPNLASFVVDSKSTLYSSKAGILYNKNQTKLIQCPERMNSVTIPETVTTIGAYAFYECKNLDSIQIPSGVTSIESDAFGFCSNIKSIEIPNGISKIESFMFSGCKSLVTVIIPSSVTSIGHWAFKYADAMGHILYRGTEEQWNQIVLDEIELSENAVVTCNYTDGMDYHVYSNIEDTECDICGQFRLVGCIDEELKVEITTKTDYGFELAGNGTDTISMRYTGQSSIIIGNNGTYCKGYVLTFSRPGNYQLSFVQETTGLTIPFSAIISDHAWDEGTITKVATETETGIISYCCQTCNKIREEIIPRLEHTHKYSMEIVDPTCTQRGYTTYTCSCGDSYTDNEVAALGHNEVTDKGYAATCTETGLADGKHCDRCNTVLTKQETLTALGHSWDAGKVTTEPTEETTGVRAYTCDTCGATKTESIPVLEHTHKYTSAVTAPTCTEKGYTTYICACGDSYVDNYVDATGHAFENGECTVCGAEDPNFVPEEETFDLVGANMTLGNNLEMNFYIDPTDLAEGEDYYAVITKSYADGREDLKITVEDDAWEDAYDMYRISLDKIAAKEMADQVTVVIYNDEGVAVSDAWKDSVRDYTMRVLKKEEAEADADKELLAMYVEMLNYGAAAQEHFGYNVSDLANSQLTDAQKAYGLGKVSMEDFRVKGDGYVGTNLVLESNILMNFFFNNIPAEHKDMYAVATYTDHYGEVKQIKVKGEDFIKHNSTTWKVPVAGLVVADCREFVTVKVYEADGTVIASVVDSIESYTARMDGNSTLYVAIMKFADAAYNSFH